MDAQSSNLSRLLDRAVAFHQAGKLSEAEQLYARILETRPDHVDALHLLGILRQRQGRKAEALALIDAALAIKPDFAEALNNHGNVLSELARPDEALASYDRALAIKPAHAQALTNRGNALRALGRHEEALASHRRSLAIRPDNAGALNNLGNAFKDLARYDEALESYRRALAIKPDYVNALVNLGNALQEVKRHEEALLSYDKALALRPDHAEALNGRGLALRALDRQEQAVASYSKALTMAPDYAEARINLGLALLEQGKLAEAVAQAEIAAKLPDRPSLPHYMLATLLARCGREEAARQHLEICLARDPGDREGARLLLAALGFEPLPERASEGLLRKTYAARAAWWDRPGSRSHSYHGAELVADALERLVGQSSALNILDAGCGTGSVGQLIQAPERLLDGVDLSPQMLARAKEKGVYRRLHQGDLVAFLANDARGYDVIACAATLIHFADLRPAFEAAANALRQGGLFIFTLFYNRHDDDAPEVGPFDGLAQAGCYVHGRGYVARLAAACGFDVEILESAIHEYSARGEPRMGLIVALRLSGRTGQRTNDRSDAKPSDEGDIR